MLSTVLFSELSKDIACNWVTVEHAQLMPRRRPNRVLQSARQLRDLRNVRMMHKRGAGALVRRSLNIRLDYLQPMSRVHDGCCGVSVILCSVGQPCLNPNIERGSMSPTFRSIHVFVAIHLFHLQIQPKFARVRENIVLF